MVNNFKEFCSRLLKCGFSMAGGNDKGIYAIIPYSWENQDSIDSSVKWHTGDPETDPWEWRMRVLEERDDIAYSKVFFRTSGYITRDWYPYFFSIRRQGELFEEAYENGTMSQTSKRIYHIISENGPTALHELKAMGDFKREDNASFEKALIELQMRMFITMCGRTQKKNKYGEGYGWNSTVFTTAENFWQERKLKLEDVNADEAYEKIMQQVLKLNPDADIKKIDRFIKG